MSLWITARRRFVAGLIVSILVCQSIGTPASAEEPPHFKDIVAKHYDHWTHGSKGILTAERVKELIQRPEIRGEEAAALASIHCFQRKAGDALQTVTRGLLTDPRKEDPNLRRDQAGSGANLTHNYGSFLKHIKSAPRHLFTTERPSLEGIAQGHLADCYFIAGVGAAVHLDPDRVHRLIYSRTDGSYDVRFANGKHVHVPPLTDAELALGSNAGHQGIWLNVLEVAAGTVEVQSSKQSHGFALDTLGEGGDSVFTIELLTGHQAKKELIRAHVKGTRPAPAETEIPKLVEQLTRQIREGLNHRRVICCGAGRWAVPRGMGQWHQYAIIGMHRGLVEIWNPWGSNYHYEPKGTPGLQHGYHTVGGKFSMPMEDFVRVFGAVNVETDHALNTDQKAK